jgi:hypothetical protein
MQPRTRSALGSQISMAHAPVASRRRTARIFGGEQLRKTASRREAVRREIDEGDDRGAHATPATSGAKLLAAPGSNGACGRDGWRRKPLARREAAPASWSGASSTTVAGPARRTRGSERRRAAGLLDPPARAPQRRAAQLPQDVVRCEIWQIKHPRVSFHMRWRMERSSRARCGSGCSMKRRISGRCGWIAQTRSYSFAHHSSLRALPARNTAARSSA